MSADFGIVLPLWSYAADGGQLLERAVGEVGLEHVTVPVVTGALSGFRPGLDPERPYFHTGGGWHFPPIAKMYSVTGLRPPKAAWFGSVDHLARLQEHTGRLGLRLVLRLDLRAVPALVVQEPFLCQRNAWGQDVPLAGVCACNPVGRELLRATLEDLRRVEPADVELVEWAPDVAVDRAAVRPWGWQAEARRLLDVCFCAACRQTAERAEVDPDQAARSVRVQIERSVAAPKHGAEDDLVRRYAAVRESDTAAWLSAVAASDPHRRCWSLGEAPAEREGEAPAEPQQENGPPRAPRLGRSRTIPLRMLVRGTGNLAHEATHGIALPVWRPAFAEAAALVRLVSEAAEHGVQFFDFEGLDEALPDAVTWVKQAVRFARRD